MQQQRRPRQKCSCGRGSYGRRRRRSFTRCSCRHFILLFVLRHFWIFFYDRLSKIPQDFKLGRFREHVKVHVTVFTQLRGFFGYEYVRAMFLLSCEIFIQLFRLKNVHIRKLKFYSGTKFLKLFLGYKCSCNAQNIYEASMVWNTFIVLR